MYYVAIPLSAGFNEQKSENAEVNSVFQVWHPLSMEFGNESSKFHPHWRKFYSLTLSASVDRILNLLR